MNKSFKITLVICFTICLFLLGQRRAFADNWYIIDSKYCTLYLADDVDKTRLYNKAYSSGDFLFGNFFSSRPPYTDTGLVKAFDNLCVKAQTILDMYPANMKVDVKIFKNQRQLNDALNSIGGQPNHEGELISYYVDNYKTIYTSEQHISKYVIAHEFGHVVSEHYFKKEIPYQIQELLAQEVELHIDD